MASFADAMRKLVEKQFKKSKSAKALKKKEKDTVAMPIIRICDSAREYNAYNDSSQGFSPFNLKTKEVVVYDGTKEGIPMDRAYFLIGRGLFAQYVNELFSLYSVGPDSWYTSGMGFYFSSFRGKGSSLKFVKETGWIRDELRQAMKSGECIPFRSLIEPNKNNIRSWIDYYKVGTVVSFLKSKQAKKPFKGIMDRYLDNYRFALAELTEKSEDEIKKRVEAAKEKAAKGVGDEDEDEEEGDEEEMSFSEKMRELNKELRNKAYRETFGDLKPEDWVKLEKAWEEWMF
jgi:hypothetical protein